MPLSHGPEQGRVSAATDIVRNFALIGEVLNPEVSTTHRLPEPNSSLRRAEKFEHEGLITVRVRFDAEDWGRLILNGASGSRCEAVLSNAEIGAIAISKIVDDAHKIKAGFEATAAAEIANFSIKVHHHLFSDAQIERPEFFLSDEFRAHCKKSYVEISWSAESPLTNVMQHRIPIQLLNALVETTKEGSYARHWANAVRHFHPEWNPDHDDAVLDSLVAQEEEEALDLAAARLGERAEPDCSDLRTALRTELDLELRDPRPGLAAFSETATLIRLRLPLNERLLELREEAERLADRMDRALAESVLDGSHTVSRADGGPSHIVVQYGFHAAVGSADRAQEVRAAHSSLFAVIAAERESFARSQEHV